MPNRMCVWRQVPPYKPGGHPPALEMRAVVNAIFYVVDGGIKWRMLPHEYPKWPSVYWYFSQWRDSGDWQRLHDTLRAQVYALGGPPPPAPTGWGAGRPTPDWYKATEFGGERGYDRGKKVEGRHTPSPRRYAELLVAVVVTLPRSRPGRGPLALCPGSARPVKSCGCSGSMGPIGGSW